MAKCLDVNAAIVLLTFVVSSWAKEAKIRLLRVLVSLLFLADFYSFG